PHSSRCSMSGLALPGLSEDGWPSGRLRSSCDIPINRHVLDHQYKFFVQLQPLSFKNLEFVAQSGEAVFLVVELMRIDQSFTSESLGFEKAGPRAPRMGEWATQEPKSNTGITGLTILIKEAN